LRETALILKGLLHNLPNWTELPSKCNVGTCADFASSKIFDLFFGINEFERTISFEPLIEPITCLVPILHLLEVIASLIVFSRFFIFIFHTHVKFDHTGTNRYGGAYYNVFCYTFKGLYLSFQ